MSNPDLELYFDLVRSNLPLFTARCFKELNPTAEFEMNWHIEAMGSHLSDVRNGDTNRLILNVPPRHLKSTIGSIAFPAWCLGQNPSAKIVCVSYAQDLSDKLAQDTRRIMMSRWYRELFPATRLESPRPPIHALKTTAGGYRLATSVGGTLTGLGGEIIVIDDPIKPADAMSDALRSSVNDWFDHTLYSRLNDKRKGAIVIIMQRLHEDDLVGHVLQLEPWDVVRFQAIAEEDEVHEYRTINGLTRFYRRKGEALHPERESLETLAQIRRTMGGYGFASQYQQAPAPLGGGMIKTEWFKRYAPHEKPEHFDRIIQSWDTANKASELNDYSVCTTWGQKGKEVYLLHVLRKQLEYPDLKRAVWDQYQLYSADVVLIEDRASGTQLLQEARRDGMHAATAYKPDSDKVMRMHAQTAIIENGFVHLPTEAPWLAEYLHELAIFPKGARDDQVDSTAQALDWIKKPAEMKGGNMFELYRRRAEQLKHPELGYIRLKAPPGRGGALTLSGRNLVIDDQGTIAVSEEDARPLIGAGWRRLEALPAVRPRPDVEYAKGSMEWEEQQRLKGQ
jgi:predicted phage terminase large subunit-like protein